MASQHGGPLPLRCAPLVAAAEWGCPPWEVTGEEATPTVRLRWFLLWQEYRRCLWPGNK